LLDERKILILQAVVHDYIQSAEPVGSRTIARRYNLGISPATIRNEMSDLEEIGYIVQPHVSAGRIPSDKGYRFYVDVLMKPERISEEFRRQIYRQLASKYREVEQLLQETTKILSLLTNYIALVVAPHVDACVLKHIQLIPIDESYILVVLVMSPGFVHNKIIEVNTRYTMEELVVISTELTKLLRGIAYRDIGVTLIKDIKDQFGDIGLALLDLISEELAHSNLEQLYFHGTLQMFNQPEFKDVEKAKALLEILEAKELLADLLTELGKNSGVQVRIGQENPHSAMQEYSLVTSTYGIGGEVIGSIGVIGPTRMEYAKVFSSVELMANILSQALTELVK